MSDEQPIEIVSMPGWNDDEVFIQFPREFDAELHDDLRDAGPMRVHIRESLEFAGVVTLIAGVMQLAEAARALAQLVARHPDRSFRYKTRDEEIEAKGYSARNVERLLRAARKHDGD